jgi:tetratricopeptide (TPR) repeat protein
MPSKLWTMITEEAAKQEKGLSLANILKKETLELQGKQTPDNNPISPRSGAFRILPFIIIFILLFAGYSLYTVAVDSEPIRVSETYIRQSTELETAVGKVKDISLTYPFNFDIGSREARASITYDVEGSTDAVKVYLILAKSQGPWRVVSARYRDSRGIIRPLKTNDAAMDLRGGDSGMAVATGKNSEIMARGHAYFKVNNFEKAAAEYGDAIQADPSAYQGYYWRGITYAKMNRDDGAIADFRKVTGLVPGHTGAFNWLGWLEYKNKMYDEAIADLTKSIALRNDYGWTYYQRGQCFLNKGLRSNALTDFEKACLLRYNQACPIADKLKTNA